MTSRNALLAAIAVALVGIFAFSFWLANEQYRADPLSCEQKLAQAGQDYAARKADPIDEWPRPCRGLTEAQREVALGNAMLVMWGGNPHGIDAPITLP